LVKAILVKGAGGGEIRHLKHLHLSTSADQETARAVVAGEQAIDPTDFAFLFEDDTPAIEAIKNRYNREIINSVAGYAYQLAGRNPSRYGYWPRKAYFRCTVAKVYRVFLNWDATKYRPDETREQLIKRLVDRDRDRANQSRVRSSRHAKFDARKRGVTCCKDAAEILGDEGMAGFCDYAMEILVMMGANGMSDEEDGNIIGSDGSSESVKRISFLPWRAPALTDLFVTVDRLPELEDLIFRATGGHKKKRIRDGTFTSNIVKHPIPKRLPAAFFDAQWLQNVNNAYAATLHKIDFEADYELAEYR
ncbi:hypothetical protein GGF50DRAFT_21109, partial [Schizophyllum commune]